MTVASENRTAVPEPLSARQEQILDAAEACFVRNGFHRSTMQDLAREARMSAPNIYRYFASKEAVLMGMALRERQRGRERIERFEKLGDRRAGMMSVIEHYHLGIPRQAAVLRLELWSESTRNPEIAEIIQERETNSAAWFVHTLGSLATSPKCDPNALFEAISALLKGVVINKAILVDYDATPAVAQLQSLIDAGLAGHLPTAETRDGHVN